MHTARSSSHLLEGVSASVHAGIHTPRVWAWRPPPGCGPWDHPPGCGTADPPRPDPSTSPLGVGLETCKACWDTTPPPPPTVNRMTDRHSYKQNLRKLRLRAVIKYNITRTFEKVPSCASDKLRMSLTNTFQSPPNYNEIPKMFQWGSNKVYLNLQHETVAFHIWPRGAPLLATGQLLYSKIKYRRICNKFVYFLPCRYNCEVWATSCSSQKGEKQQEIWWNRTYPQTSFGRRQVPEPQL